MALDTPRIISLMDDYEVKIRNSVYLGVKPVRHENPGHEMKPNMEHALFMAGEIKAMCDRAMNINLAVLDMNEAMDRMDEMRSIREKIMRWLGWLQCTLCFFRLCTLDDCKRHIMPLGEEFKADGGSPQLTLNPDREVFGVKFGNSGS